MKNRTKLTSLVSASMLTVFTLIGSVQASPITPNVTRLFGQDRFQTSVAVAKQAFTGQQMQNVIIASGYNFPDALAASTLATKLKAPILLAGNSVLDSQVALDYIKSSLVAGGTITIVGGSAIVPKQVEEWLSSAGYNVVRLGGQDRFDTDALITNKLNVPTGTPVVLASGNDFPDALGVASVAASKGWPILLSGPNHLPDSVKSFLATEQPSDAYIVGGETILSNTVLGEIHMASPNTKMTRFGGYDRFGTLAQVVTTFYPNPTEVFLANGLDFADALSGSVNAAQKNAPILLIDPTAVTLSPAIREYLVNHRNLTSIPKVNVLGGTAAVPELAVDLVNASLGNSTMPYPEPAPTPVTTPVAVPATAIPSDQLLVEKQLMLDLINQERVKAGVSPLSFDSKLQEMAQAKSDDMYKNKYFSHTSPTYGSPFDMMKTFGIKFGTAGENIAYDRSVEAAHTALMNSSGHKENILRAAFKKVGIGITHTSSSVIYISQDFTD